MKKTFNQFPKNLFLSLSYSRHNLIPKILQQRQPVRIDAKPLFFSIHTASPSSSKKQKNELKHTSTRREGKRRRRRRRFRREKFNEVKMKKRRHGFVLCFLLENIKVDEKSEQNSQDSKKVTTNWPENEISNI